MKTKATLLLVLGLLCALLIGCAAQQNVKLAYIGADEAKALALRDAGLDAQSASGFSTDMGTRDGLDYYSVRFTANGKSYSYDVDALTGSILARGGAADAAQNAPAAEAAQLSPTAEAASAQLAPATATAAAGEIGAEQAKAIALAHAGLSAADVTFIRAEPDFDDGRRVYEIEFYGKDYTEYDYDVDMASGEILSFDRDAEYYDGKPAASAAASANAEGLIGEAEAKRIALAHAGLAEGDVEFVRSHLEYDDGRREYELEFYTADGMEYDYDIDAQSGRILSHDRDAEYYRPAAQQQGSQSSGSQSGSSGASISEAEARAIALAQVPGADESHIRKFKVDRDDGRLEYDGEIVYNNMEYEFEIDAYSGAIRDWDVESVFDD